MNPILAIGLVAVVAGVFFDAASPDKPKTKRTVVEHKSTTEKKEEKKEEKPKVDEVAD